MRGTLKEGSKGPICDFAFVRVSEARGGVSGPRLWLIIRRKVADPNEIKFYFGNVPEDIETLDLVWMSGVC